MTDEYFHGWAFLNHISLLYYYGLLNALRKINDSLPVDNQNYYDEKHSYPDILYSFFSQVINGE